jgi:hypothetical protein
MDMQQVVIAAQTIMGSPGGISCDMQRRPVSRHWTEEECRARFQPADVWEWCGRLLALEQRGKAGWCMYVAPEMQDGDGVWHAIPGWRNLPGEEPGEMTINAAGVLELARWYGEGLHI